MRSIRPHIGSIILLLSAILALSGIAATAEALVHADEVSGCCDNDSNGKEPGSGPCSVPDCPCASCLVIDFDTPRLFSSIAPAVIAFNPQQQLFPLSEFVNSIDYPPEPL